MVSLPNTSRHTRSSWVDAGRLRPAIASGRRRNRPRSLELPPCSGPDGGLSNKAGSPFEGGLPEFFPPKPSGSRWMMSDAHPRNSIAPESVRRSRDGRLQLLHPEAEPYRVYPFHLVLD